MCSSKGPGNYGLVRTASALPAFPALAAFAGLHSSGGIEKRLAGYAAEHAAQKKHRKQDKDCAARRWKYVLCPACTGHESAMTAPPPNPS